MSEESGKYVDIVFDGPPGPEPNGFVEVEDAERRSIRFGEWVERDDGCWALRISDSRPFSNIPSPEDLRKALDDYAEAYAAFHALWENLRPMECDLSEGDQKRYADALEAERNALSRIRRAMGVDGE